MKTDKRTILVIVGTVILAILAVFGAWRLYQLRGQAVAPTAPKLVPAQEVASCPAVSFTVGGGCPVANSTCCKQPLTTCDNSLQCDTGYACTLGYCVKQTYDEHTNTCPAPQPATPVGSGGEGDGGGTGGTPAGGAAPATSPSPRPSVSPSPSPSPSASPKAAAGATSSPSPSSTQTAQAGTSTTAASATTKAGSTAKAQEKLPEAGVSWPFTVIMGGGVLLLILGIVLAF